MLLCQLLKLLRNAVVPLVKDVDVRLENTDVRSNLVCQRQHLLCGVYVGRDAQISLFALHQLQALARQRALGSLRALAIGHALRRGGRRRRRRVWLCRVGVLCLVGLNERADLRRDVVAYILVLHEHREQLLKCEGRVQLQPVLLQVLRPSLLPIDEHDDVLHHQLLLVERLQRLQHARAGRDKVLHDEAAVARLVRAFNRLLGAIILDLLAAHDHLHVEAKRHARRDRQRSVWDTADDIALNVLDAVPHHAGDLL
mmetsp:Transcript_41943/g.125514  ORF Transcript_41943/g.125514 Transcript_41943/m.125514 type:complete len:256 (-) Transcript_41943:274-1041(-)